MAMLYALPTQVWASCVTMTMSAKAKVKSFVAARLADAWLLKNHAREATLYSHELRLPYPFLFCMQSFPFFEYIAHSSI